MSVTLVQPNDKISPVHASLLKYDTGYRTYFETQEDALSPVGLTYSEMYDIVHSWSLLYFEQEKKANRRRLFLNGTVSVKDVIVLQYKNSLMYKNHRTVMAKIKHYFLYEEKIRPLLKWPGGKTTDLGFIVKEYPYLIPNNVRNYYEPFLGGGAFWLAMNSEKMFVNDLCDDLISFYGYIKKDDPRFFNYMESMGRDWDILRDIADHDFETIAEGGFEAVLDKYREPLEANFFSQTYKRSYIRTLCKIVASKVKNIRRVEEKKEEALSQEDLKDNIEGALKAGYYTAVRNIYNKLSAKDVHTTLRAACFYFLRDYCFSSMFRYNAAGGFNVPYGGVSYNSRNPAARIESWKNDKVQNHLKKTELFQLDFETFLSQNKPTKEDFIFLDPPYDSDFSTYDKNEFGLDDQRRLAKFLVEDCDAQFLAIMKNTELIKELYSNKPGIQTYFFDKKYSVSFMDRNAKDVEHIVVSRLY